MIDKFGNYLLDNVLYKGETVTEEKREVMLFGIVRILEDIPKYTGIFLLSMLLNILPDVGIVLLITIMYKIFVGGAHARTNIGCFVSSALYFWIPVYVSKNTNLSETIIYIIYSITFLFSMYIIVKIAPADTGEVPILNKNRRKKMKMCAFLSLSLIYIISLVFINNSFMQMLIVVTILLTDILATKPLYRFFKCQYSYETEEFDGYYKNQVI